MLGTDAAIFVIILGGVYQRNHGKQILSTMYHEVRGFSLAIAYVPHVVLRASFGLRFRP